MNNLNDSILELLNSIDKIDSDSDKEFYSYNDSVIVKKKILDEDEYLIFIGQYRNEISDFYNIDNKKTIKLCNY